MLGVYDYTVILTYISVLSASTGIFVTLTNPGHPYIGMVFLLLCGLCDTFDGKVARTKKNRTKSKNPTHHNSLHIVYSTPNVPRKVVFLMSQIHSF